MTRNDPSHTPSDRENDTSDTTSGEGESELPTTTHRTRSPVVFRPSPGWTPPSRARAREAHNTERNPMTIMARKISHAEFTRTLPLLARIRVRNDILEACAEIAEAHGAAAIPKGVELYYDDGELLALAQSDDLEAGIDHGDGTLLVEFEVGQVFHRCITCGQANPQMSSWCSQRCRNLLRALGRTLTPGLDDSETLTAAERWAVHERNAHVGWHGPLTRAIAEALYWRG